MAIPSNFGARARAIGALFAICLSATVLNAQPAAADLEAEATPTTSSEAITVVDAEISDRMLRTLANNPSAAPPGTLVSIEVHASDLTEAAHAVSAVGGTIYGEVPGYFVEARVPVDQLGTLHSDNRVLRIRRVTRTSATVRTQLAAPPNDQLQNTITSTLQLQPWHDAGYKGAGQKIGIIDIFGLTEFQEARAESRLPEPSGVFCRRLGEACSITHISSEPHGVGVAELAHRAAPDAEIYLATAYTLGDLSAAIDWFISQGVTIINRSETSEFDGPGDGTGPVNSILDRAIASDVVFVSAAGNAGGEGERNGQNWVGFFNDPDGNGVHNWTDGSERMAFRCGFLLGMRWDDWDGSTIATDYDLWIYDTLADSSPEARGNDIQSTVNDPALEHISPVCNSTTDIDYFAIVKFGDPQPDGVDQLQILGNFTPMDEWTNTSSATGPGADSANPGAVTVGATTRPATQVAASYSSHGPTLDGRINPDLTAASCFVVKNFPGCFTGTSSSAPFVAGVLAVLRGAGVYDSAAAVDQIIPQITIDRGANGPDNRYGNGVLALPPPSAFNLLSVDQLCLGLVPTITGTDQADVLVGTPGPDVIKGGGGNDTIRGGGGNDVICGDSGRDRIYGGRGRDLIDGGDQRDRIWGEAGADTITGGNGLDRIVGNLGSDVISGLGNDDRIKGGPGNDTLRGGSGDDVIEGHEGSDNINGGTGFDVCSGFVYLQAPDLGDIISRCEDG